MVFDNEAESPFSRTPRSSLVKELAGHIRDQILSGQLKPGEQLPTEEKLCILAGVSRTVVREAIATLRAERLVTTRRGAGMFVLVPEPNAFKAIDIDQETVDDILGILEVRLAIEVEMAMLAASRRAEEDLERISAAMDAFSDAIRQNDGENVRPDLAFHLSVAQASHNKWFVNSINNFGEFALPRSHVPGYGRFLLPKEHLDTADLEHRAIFDAIAARDPMQAAVAVRVHLGGSRVRYMAMMRRADAEMNNRTDSS